MTQGETEFHNRELAMHAGRESFVRALASIVGVDRDSALFTIQVFFQIRKSEGVESRMVDARNACAWSQSNYSMHVRNGNDLLYDSTLALTKHRNKANKVWKTNYSNKANKVWKTDFISHSQYGHVLLVRICLLPYPTE